MRRRRRRSGGAWFPINPTYYPNFGTFGASWTEETLTIANGAVAPGATVVKAIPLTLDANVNVDTGGADVTLADYVSGQDYLAKRVVGNVWFNHPEATGLGGDNLCLRSICCIALAVLPYDSAVGGDIGLDAVEWHPLLAQNTQSPWMWRRTWQLANPTVAYIPGTTSGLGAGIKDSGFLDTKGIMRRISREQRLYLIAAAGVLEVAGESSNDSVWTFGYDLRIFGQLKRAHNRSVFT